MSGEQVPEELGILLFPHMFSKGMGLGTVVVPWWRWNLGNWPGGKLEAAATADAQDFRCPPPCDPTGPLGWLNGIGISVRFTPPCVAVCGPRLRLPYYRTD